MLITVWTRQDRERQSSSVYFRVPAVALVFHVLGLRDYSRSVSLQCFTVIADVHSLIVGLLSTF